MTTPEILRAAAAEVRKGWVRHIRHDDHGFVCALGAIENAVAGRTLTMQEAIDHWWSVVEDSDAVVTLQRVVGAQRIAPWNNAYDQTAENVAATMELAAICSEQEHAAPAAADAVREDVDATTV